MNDTNQNELIISLRNVKKKYGEFEALKTIDLDVRKGELFGFIGPNGAGKTTMIRIMTGIIKPTSGTILIEGIDLLREPERAKFKVGYVPDRPYLYEKLTPLEHFEFVGGLYSVPYEQIQRIGEDMLRLFVLWEWRTELIESFSHGMKQKIAITSSLLHDPHVLIVDEPMVGLDPKSARLVKDIFLKLAGRGTTLFMCTHVLEIAEKLCDRVGIMIEGRMTACGTVSELEAQAKTTGSDLEGIFLSLTGGAEYGALLRYL